VEGGRYGHGQLLLVGSLLLVQTEEGEGCFSTRAPTLPASSRASALLEGKTWNPPALLGSRLLVRNDREAALYELPVVTQLHMLTKILNRRRGEPGAVEMPRPLDTQLGDVFVWPKR
jgi:hypothetical protein